jgi:AraC-like DNA-binding protein
MEEITIDAQMIRENIAGLQKFTSEWPAILGECGISDAGLACPGKRYPIGNAVTLHQTALRILNDETLGLLEKRTPRGFFRLLVLNMIHTRSLEASIVRLAEFMNLFENTFLYSVVKRGNSTVLQLSPTGDTAADRAFITGWLMTIAHRLFSWLVNERIVPRQVNFDFSVPEYHREYYYAFYGAAVNYDQEFASIVYRTSDLDLPIVQTEASVEKYIARFPVDFLIPVEMGGDSSREVRMLVMEYLKSQNEVPGIEEVSARLGVNPRSLRRQLKSEHTSYKTITMQVRRDIAMYHLGHDQVSIEKIAELAGYSDTSSFIRVFKSWTGFTPLAFRKGV